MKYSNLIQLCHADSATLEVKHGKWRDERLVKWCTKGITKGTRDPHFNLQSSDCDRGKTRTYKNHAKIRDSQHAKICKNQRFTRAQQPAANVSTRSSFRHRFGCCSWPWTWTGSARRARRMYDLLPDDEPQTPEARSARPQGQCPVAPVVRGRQI